MCLFFFCKRKTAYEMRISDWSSDVCSSDLHGMPRHPDNPTSATPDMDFITQWFWLFLLLPVAALSGWVIGRRGGERHSDTQVSRLSTTYFRGLNYLLNEQPDK